MIFKTLISPAGQSDTNLLKATAFSFSCILNACYKFRSTFIHSFIRTFPTVLGLIRLYQVCTICPFALWHPWWNRTYLYLYSGSFV